MPSTFRSLKPTSWALDLKWLRAIRNFKNYFNAFVFIHTREKDGVIDAWLPEAEEGERSKRTQKVAWALYVLVFYYKMRK